MKSPIILRIFKNNQLLEVKQFDSDQIIFGHDADVTVDLNDESVSAIHCLIELRDSGYYLCDMGSTSGTKKNGNPVLDEPISSGDNIEVGPFRVQFFVGAPKPKVAPGAPSESTQAGLAPSAPIQNAEPVEMPPPPAEAVAPTPPAPTTPAQPAKPATPPPPKGPPTKAAIPPVVPQAPKASVQPPVPTPPAAKVKTPQQPPVQPSSRPPKLPEIKASEAPRSKTVGGGTFAPPSEVKDLGGYLKPTKGPVVEVIIAWQERVLSTHHFGGDATVTIGSATSADIFLPGQFIRGAVPFLELKGGCKVLAPNEMSIAVTNSAVGEVSMDEMLKSGKVLKAGAGHAVRLDQGELLCLSIGDKTLQIFVRYVPNTIKPILGSPFDFSAGELTGIVVSMVIVALTALYMSVYTPEMAEEKPEEQVRLAQFIYNKLPPTTTLAKVEPPPPPPKVVEQKPPPPPPPPKVIKVTEEKKEATQKGNKQSVSAVKELEAAKAAEVRPNPANVNRPKKFTSTNKGGAVKMSDTASANAQSAKDVTKVGLLSAFGGGGVRKKLDEAYTGSGELLGMANEATGTSGQNENRDGDDIGSKFKNTGAGGKGTATQGISGIGTKGRASGMSNYGGGIGLGGKGNVTIDAGGAEEGWEGTIDREAVRRVIKSILSQIKSCYERQLRVNSTLEGKVVIRFEIMEQGRVRSAKTQSTTLSDSTVESCVASRIREARFPEPPPGTIAQVDYPFVFGAQK